MENAGFLNIIVYVKNMADEIVIKLKIRHAEFLYYYLQNVQIQPEKNTADEIVEKLRKKLAPPDDD